MSMGGVLSIPEGFDDLQDTGVVFASTSCMSAKAGVKKRSKVWC